MVNPTPNQTQTQQIHAANNIVNHYKALKSEESSEIDREQSKQLVQMLDEDFPTESEERMKHREQTLKELKGYLLEWIVEMGTDAKMTEAAAKATGGDLITFGSYALGVVSKLSDIDAVCVAPMHCSREQFFESFVPKLEEMDNVKEVQALPDAYTPIVKLQMNDIDIDLLFARLHSEKVEGDIAKMEDGKLLQNMDDRSVRSINGCRVAAKILEQVKNKKSFEVVLRFIKYWARQRGIYSNVTGFFGGITWSIMVARLFQLYPNYSPAQMVQTFFTFYHNWPWSWRHPVQLCDPSDTPSKNIPGLANLKVWNPKSNPGDRVHLAPVVTPSFPAMNSTHNVTETTKRIIQEQFKHAMEVIQRVQNKEDDTEWRDVYNRYPFFSMYRHFLLVEMTARNEDVMSKWRGWIESKLRILIKQLETTATSMLVHPYVNFFDFGPDGDWPLGTACFIGLAFPRDQGAHTGQQIDCRGPVSQFVDVVGGWTEKDVYGGQFQLRIKRVRREALPTYITAEDTEAGVEREYKPDKQGTPTSQRKRPSSGNVNDSASKLRKSAEGTAVTAGGN